MTTPIDCSLEAQAAVLRQYPDLFEGGFAPKNDRFGVSKTGSPRTSQANMEKLVAWVINNPPKKDTGSYGYKHQAEGERFDKHGEFSRRREDSALNGDYVSNGMIILAAILAGYTPVNIGVNCEFRKEKTK